MTMTMVSTNGTPFPFSVPYLVGISCLLAVLITTPFWFDDDDPTAAAATDDEVYPRIGDDASSTSTLTSTTTPANLSDSAFPMEHYATLLDEAYASLPCVPKRIHLSQTNNVHEIAWNESTNFHNLTSEFVVDMTLSFMLDYTQCQNVTTKVYYRQGYHPEITVTPRADPLHFNFTYATSPNTTATFQSDCIYHVTLPRIKAGGHRYFYRIEVTNKKEQEQEISGEEGEEVTTVVSEMGDQVRQLRGGGGGGASSLSSSSSSPSLLVGKTPIYNFITPPLPNTPTAIALVGDLGQTKNSTKTMAHILHDSLKDGENKNPTTLLLIAGDMSYADSNPLRWISWFDLMEPLLRSLPMHVAAGNHEIECDNATLEVFKPYENYFHNPNRIAAADLLPITEKYRKTLPWGGYCSTPSEFRGHYNYGNAFYSFRHGLVHFIILSSYSDTRRGSPQYEWLFEELQYNVNRTLTPWLIVSFHSPLYTTFVGHVNETQSWTMKQAMEPLFGRFDVNLVISGHDHGYMRTHPLTANGTVDSTGKSPIYLTLGAGGNREQHSKGYRNSTHPEAWVAKRDLKDFGYGNLLVVNASHATLTWVRDKISGSDDESDDKNVWIVNQHYHNHSVNDKDDNTLRKHPAAVPRDDSPPMASRDEEPHKPRISGDR